MSGLSTRRLLLPAVALASASLLLVGCAQQSSTSESSAAASESAAPSESASAEPTTDECSVENLPLSVSYTHLTLPTWRGSCRPRWC